MENEIVCWWRIALDHDRRDVSALAGHIEDRGVVSKYGFLGIDRAVLRYGTCATDTLLHDRLHGTAWALAISEFVRGCGLL